MDGENIEIKSSFMGLICHTQTAKDSEACGGLWLYYMIVLNKIFYQKQNIDQLRII